MKKLGFGLMRLPLIDPEDHSSVDMPQFCKMVDLFLERGFTYFDTAYMYHDGVSESVAKEALVDRHARDSFTLTTKLPTFFLKKQGDQERIFEEQIRRCGVEYFDYYLLHNLGEENYKIAQKFKSFQYVSRLKEQGLVRRIGFSFHDKAPVLDRILTEHPEIEFVQLQINFLDWNDEGVQSRLCYETAVRHGKKVIIMEPVKGGRLANVPDEVKKILTDKHADWSPASWAIRFAASLPEAVVVLSGMSDMAQLEENTSFMRDFKSLEQDELDILRRAEAMLRASISIPCTNCRYCTEGCPQNIPIPEYFAIYNEKLKSESKEKTLKTALRSLTDKGYGKPEDCIGCKQCERACPQHLAITEYLKKVGKSLFD